MGSILYDYLTESPLFSERHLSEDYRRMSDGELVRELEQYRGYCEFHKEELASEVPPEDGTNLFFPRVPSLHELKRTALYARCHVVSDPLFGLSPDNRSRFSDRFLRGAGVDDALVDRKELVAAVRFMRSVTPMVAGDCLRFLPTPPGLVRQPFPTLFRPGSEASAAEAAEEALEQLPKPLVAYLREFVVVRSLIVDNGKTIESRELQPSRMISVHFKGAPPSDGFSYTLHEADADALVEALRRPGADLKFTVPETPPSRERFDAWVNESVSVSILRFVHNLMTFYGVASDCKASLRVPSPLQLGVLHLLGAFGSGVPEAAAASVLRLDLPFLDSTSLGDLVRVRTTDGPAFEAFRRRMELEAQAIRLESDPVRLKTMYENLSHQVGEIEVKQCDQQIQTLRRKGLIEGAVGLVSMFGAFHTAGWSALPGILALANGYKTWTEYRTGKRELPGYFLWSLKKTRRSEKEA